MRIHARHTFTGRLVAGLVLAAWVFAPAAPAFAASTGGGCAATMCATMGADMPSPCHHTGLNACAHGPACLTAPAAIAEAPSGVTAPPPAPAQPVPDAAPRAGRTGTAPPTPPPNS